MLILSSSGVGEGGGPGGNVELGYLDGVEVSEQRSTGRCSTVVNSTPQRGWDHRGQREMSHLHIHIPTATHPVPHTKPLWAFAQSYYSLSTAQLHASKIHPGTKSKTGLYRGQLIDKSRRLSILARRQKEIPNIPTFSSRSAPIAYQLFDPEALYGCTHRLQAFPSTIFFFSFFYILTVIASLTRRGAR